VQRDVMPLRALEQAAYFANKTFLLVRLKHQLA
jgi:hypothetical protein